MKTRELAAFEDFLVHGPVEPPNSRATKDELWQAVRERDELLVTVRRVLLSSIAHQLYASGDILDEGTTKDAVERFFSRD
ncbi:MAG: hypothetical protein AAFX06_33380 [Planctomycetota bacterium]